MLKTVVEILDSSFSDASLAMNFTFTENSTECLNVTIDDDTLIEGEEMFDIRLFSVFPDGAVTLLSNNSAIITIEDNEGWCGAFSTLWTLL